MGWLWALPFVGILLSIASGPQLFPKVWHNHYGKTAVGWAACALVPIAWTSGGPTMLAAFLHAILTAYLSFIVLLFALYTVAGGILVTGARHGTPLANTATIALGTAMASVVGTTGAAMILIRPLIQANEKRQHNIHVFIFFIILVANIGGALSPLGDPPLFVGFLRGVEFFWTTKHIWLQTAIVAIFLLTLFFSSIFGSPTGMRRGKPLL
jgi:Na+/H+ antiporter NhaD/arsenite permease-like protein